MFTQLTKFLVLLSFLCYSGTALGQSPADGVAEMGYYLPQDVTYDSAIPTPTEILDMVPGEWHVRHDQLVTYMRAVAEASDRVTIEEIGKTYENRSLLVLTITSPDNQANIEQIRQNHVALTDPDRSPTLNLEEMPLVTYMGYSIHGDEPSGSNASMLFAYYLAAAQGPDIEQMLDNLVILIDPSLNPDGLNRFAHWANSRKSKTLVTDPNNMEQNQPWPSGRTNHYWFDLNRDWLLVQHPESQARIAMFHRWKPNILTDHHEMGTNSTYFFQPGIPSRTHPLTPERNQQITEAIGEYHADILDDHQRLYFSKETYDDFYYGKGSTYPDINGSIGILFEQASSRSHAQESEHGVITFPFTIKNQLLTSFSTIRAAADLRTEILNHQRTFFREARQQAGRSSVKAYIFGDEEDNARSYRMAELIRRHDVEVYTLAESVSAGGETFEAGSSYIIPAEQPQFRFIESLFERRTSFQDSLFYDVSSWTLPYAFNLPFAELGNRAYSNSQLGEPVAIDTPPTGKVIGGKASYAYLFEWDEYYAPRALYRIQKLGVRAKVATRPFTAVTANGVHRFDYGSILVPVGPQDVEVEAIHEWARNAAQHDGLDIYAVRTGLTPTGIDLGSNDFESIDRPSVAILAGGDARSYDVGEAWHLLDRRYEMPASLITPEVLGDNDTDLDRYTAFVMLDGNYDDLPEEGVEKIERWVREGGTLITVKDAVEWAVEQGLASVTLIKRPDEDPAPKPYASMDQRRDAQDIGGAIFNARLDLTHPLGYGFNDPLMTVFRGTTIFMETPDTPYASPLRYTQQPLASGYVSEENEELMKGTAAIVVNRLDDGRVITMTDNPNFRAFWYGTNKLFANAIFFGQTIARDSALGE